MLEDAVMEKAYEYWSQCGRTLQLHDTVRVAMPVNLHTMDFSLSDKPLKIASVPVHRILAYAAARVAQAEADTAFAEQEMLHQLEISARYRSALFKIGVPTKTLNDIRDGIRPNLEGHNLC